MSKVDWLNQLKMITVSGRLEVRCAYCAPGAWLGPRPRHTRFLITSSSRAGVIKNPEAATTRELLGGDIVLLPHGSEHVIPDGRGKHPRTHTIAEVQGMHAQHDGHAEHLDMLCRRFFIGPLHDRLTRNYLLTDLVTRAMDSIAARASGRPQITWPASQG